MTLQEQIDQLKQTPDHRLTPTELRFRNVLVALYEIVMDMQMSSKKSDNIDASNLVLTLPNPTKKNKIKDSNSEQ